MTQNDLKKEFKRTVRQEIYFFFVIACAFTVLFQGRSSDILIWVIFFLILDIMFNPEQKAIKQRLCKFIGIEKI